MPDRTRDIILSAHNTVTLHCKRRRLFRRSKSDSNIFYHSMLGTVEKLVRLEFFYLVSKATRADVEQRKQFAKLQRRLRQQMIVEETVEELRMPQSRRMAVRRQAIYRKKTTIIVSTTTLVMIVTIAVIVTIFLLISPDIELMICEQSNHLYGDC